MWVTGLSYTRNPLRTHVNVPKNCSMLGQESTIHPLIPALLRLRVALGLEMPYSVRFPCATAQQAPRCQSPKAEEQEAMASGSGELPVCWGLPATTAGELRGGQRADRVGHHLTHEPIGKPYMYKGKQQPIQVAAKSKDKVG